MYHKRMKKVLEKLKNGEIMSTGKYRAESVTVTSPYNNIYSYSVDTIYGVEDKTSYYQWFNEYALLWGWLPGGIADTEIY